jgi:CRISPR-associated protein Cas1
MIAMPPPPPDPAPDTPDSIPDSTPDNTGLFAEATRLDRLEDAWERVRANAGAAGGDGETVARFAGEAATRLLQLHRALRNGRYRPGPVRRVDIPKAGGGARPLCIPCVADRVAQTAVMLTLMPVLEPEMEDDSFAYRPGRSVRQAVARVIRHRDDGFQWVVDGDIERYFERVPHERLLARLRRAVGDGPLTELVATWLEAAEPTGRGLPQGAPVSPLLANLYLDDVDEAIARRGVRLVRFADDFVLLCRDRDRAEAALDRIAALLAGHGLRLNADKTRIVSFEQGFRFLGHLFVRSLVLASPNRLHAGAESEDEAALRLLAGRDAAAERDAAEAAAAAERDDRAGFDRGLRVLYVTEPGRRLSVRNEAFTVEEAGGGPDDPALGWRELIAIPHRRLDRIEIGPAGEAVPAALRHGLATDTPVAFVNGHGQTLGVLAPPETRRARLHLDQARHALDPDLRLDLARRIVDGRLRNQRALLRRLNRQRRDKVVLDALLALNRTIRRLPVAADVPALMGHEGEAAARYWPALVRMLEGDWSFDRRRRHPPPDPVNAMLSFLAALLTRDVAALADRHGLHPGFGALHSARDGHQACVYDLVEEFRAPLVEGLTVYLVNNRMLRPPQFGTAPDGGCRIGREAARAMIRGYEAWLDRPVKSPRGGRRVLWRRLVEEQAVAYAAHVGGGEPYRPYVMDY